MPFTTVRDAYGAFCRLFGDAVPAWTYEQFRVYRFADGTRYEDIDENWLDEAYEMSLREQDDRDGCEHVSEITPDGNGVYCRYCGETL